MVRASFRTLAGGLSAILLSAPTVMAQNAAPPPSGTSAPPAAAAPSGPLVPDSAYAGPAKLVDVGGRKLNLLCMGSGSPLVVLETGAAGNVMNWRRVQARIGEFTRVCAYDRAGYGYSDPANRPPTAANAVDDLRTLLRRAGEKSPIVLVGWSLGGLHATLYADKHFSDVAGMVLIDPVFSGVEQRFATQYSAAELADQAQQKEAWKKHSKECADLARAGKLPDPNAKCESPPPGLPAVMTAAFTRFYAEPQYYETVVAEDEASRGASPGAVSEDDKEEKAAARSFGDMPLIVLSAERSFGLAEHGRTAIVREGHQLLAARSTVGKWMVVPKSTHSIQVDQPDAVVGAVREVVDAVRSKHPG